MLRLSTKKVRETGTTLSLSIALRSVRNTRKRNVWAQSRCVYRSKLKIEHFREDLFYRIAVFQIELPPLRERVIDIEDLANYFLKSFLFKANKKVTSISKEYIEALKQHQWNGNIREPKTELNVVILSDDELVIESLPLDSQILTTPVGETIKHSAFNLASAEKYTSKKC
nr:hypothetical protein [Candidatus Brachybacter algidus]